MIEELSTVFIIDDDASVRRSLRRLVSQAGWNAQDYASAEEFLLSLKNPLLNPTCIVVDLQMPGLSGLELQTELAKRNCECPVIFISGNATIASTVRAMQQGAVTFLVKPFEPIELLNAIEQAIEKCRAVLATVAKLRVIEMRVAALTMREREVMSWVITGALNKQIAAALSIVEQTVKVHRARVMEKMCVVSIAELVRLCDAIGFLPAGTADESS